MHEADIAYNKASYSTNALIFAAISGHKDVVELLIKHGINKFGQTWTNQYINSKDDHGMTSLLYAANGGYKDLLELLIEYGADIFVVDNKGGTIFLHATRSGSIEVMEFLLNNDFDINKKNQQHDYTALTFAAINNNDGNVVRFLINNGANINLKNSRGKTALEDAFSSLVIKILKNFKINNIKFFPRLVKAIENNNFEEVKKLLRMPIYLINLDTGENALHIAAKIRNINMFRFIFGIRPGLIKKKNYDCKSPLDLNPEILIWLVIY